MVENGFSLGPPEAGGEDKIWGGDMGYGAQMLVGGPYDDKIFSGNNM